MQPRNLRINHDCIDAINAGEEIPDQVEVDGDVFPLVYHSTDPWRGYYETEAAPGWTKLDDGWMTGEWSDAPPGTRSSEVEEVLAARCLANPHQTYAIIFAPTSNVFSTAYDVFVKE